MIAINKIYGNLKVKSVEMTSAPYSDVQQKNQIHKTSTKKLSVIGKETFHFSRWKESIKLKLRSSVGFIEMECLYKRLGNVSNFRMMIYIFIKVLYL